MGYTIGVLALQGAFREHIDMLKQLEVKTIEIKTKEDFLNHKIDGLILPGGESTVMGKLLHDFDLYDCIKQAIKLGMPVFGTCAGMILLAKDLENDPTSHFGIMDICVKRNAYGRQLGSFKTYGTFQEIERFPMIFIRAPYITKTSSDVEILAIQDSHIIAAKQNNVLVTSFHPELSDDTRIHEYFLQQVKNYAS